MSEKSFSGPAPQREMKWGNILGRLRHLLREGKGRINNEKKMQPDQRTSAGSQREEAGDGVVRGQVEDSSEEQTTINTLDR